MNDNLDIFVTELQERIFEETKKTYGEIGFHRWLNPLYAGTIDNPDGYGRVTGLCGDTIQFFLTFNKNKVKTAKFLTDGCGASLICASFAAELAIDKSPDEIMEITGDKIIKILGCFPEEDQHCAFLAVESLQEALHDYMLKQTQKKNVDSAD